MEIYSRTNWKSTNEQRKFAGRLPSFASFCDRRDFQPIPVATVVRPAHRAYYALPVDLYGTRIADEAAAMIAEHTEEIVDPRRLFSSSDDWRRRCGRILHTCDALYCLLARGREVSPGSYVEAAYSSHLGLPIYILAWRLHGPPRIELGGGIVPLRDARLSCPAAYIGALRRLECEANRTEPAGA